MFLIYFILLSITRASLLNITNNITNGNNFTTISPTLLPTIAPTPSPSLSPTSIPTIYYNESNKPCEGKFYNIDENYWECIECPIGRTNLNKDDKDCNGYISDIPYFIVVGYCFLYSLSSISLYTFYMKNGVKKTFLVTLLLILLAQVTNILNATLLKFKNEVLFYFAFIFCGISSICYLILLTHKTKVENLVLIRYINECNRRFAKLGVIGGSFYPQDDDSVTIRAEGPNRVPISLDKIAYFIAILFVTNPNPIESFDFLGWVAHDFLRLNTYSFFTTLILIICDLLWPILRVIIVSPGVILCIIYQIMLAFLGLLAYSSKTMAIKSFKSRFWQIWSGEIATEEDLNAHEIIPGEMNFLILIEIIFQAIFQVCIQAANNFLLYEVLNWPTLTLISVLTSVVLTVTFIYHIFQFYYSDGVAWESIPCYDIIGVSSSGRNQYTGLRKRDTIEEETKEVEA